NPKVLVNRINAPPTAFEDAPKPLTISDELLAAMNAQAKAALVDALAEAELPATFEAPKPGLAAPLKTPNGDRYLSLAIELSGYTRTGGSWGGNSIRVTAKSLHRSD